MYAVVSREQAEVLCLDGLCPNGSNGSNGPNGSNGYVSPVCHVETSARDPASVQTLFHMLLSQVRIYGSIELRSYAYIHAYRYPLGDFGIVFPRPQLMWIGVHSI